jgi:hypothetical protein
MRQERTHHDAFDYEQHYARVEWIILDLQLSISGVHRANGCLDLGTVRQIRAAAAETLRNADAILRRYQAEPSQAQRIAERRRSLAMLLEEPAPIERLARTMHVG